MEKNKKITLEQLRSHSRPIRRTVMWYGIAMTVRTLLTPSEVSQFVDSVVSVCYDQERDVIMPEMLDFAFRINLISRYAYVELPEKFEEQYELLYNTDLYDTVVSSVNSGQIEAIRNAIHICMSNTK